jgi:hypothetical protein
MSTTLNHRAHARARLAEASELADAGSTDLARVRLLSAADHALIALRAREQAHPELDRLRTLDHGTDEMQAGFGLVQALIDASLAEPALSARHAAAPQIPLYGGPRGAMNARGAEAAARGLAHVSAALRRTLRR